MSEKAIMAYHDVEAVIRLAVDGLGSVSSRRIYRRVLRDFLAWHDGQDKPGLSKATVQAYKAHLQQECDLAAASINVALSAIRRLAREAGDNGLLDQETAAAVERVRNVPDQVVPAGRSIAPGEIAGLMLACAGDRSPAGRRDAAMIGLLYATGARRSEVVGLDLADYDPESGALVIRRGKGNKQRTVYVTNGADQALADWLAVRGSEPGPIFCPINKGGRITIRRLSGQVVRRMLIKRTREAGIEAATPHDFRRTTVGDLLDVGADLVTVQRIVGHSSPTTTARYDRRPERTKRKAARLLHLPYFGQITAAI
jgi:integrase/recombinase XerD